MKTNIIVELKHSKKLQQLFETAVDPESESKPKMSANTIPNFDGFSADKDFGRVAIPTQNPSFDSTLSAEENLYDTEANVEFFYEPDKSTFIVRGEVDTKDMEAFEKQCKENDKVVGVYADLQIEPTLVCPGSSPVGTDKTVEKLLGLSRLHSCKANGSGVRVAIVDTGVNMAYLNSKGKTPRFSASGSWKPSTSSITPGSAPVGHGTMCAYDVCIAAPNCTILDIALLTTRRRGSTVMEGFLSDAILAYQHLIRLQRRVSPRPGVNKSLVVNNSWGMFHPSWDFPVGHPGNYSDNPNHPFNRIVRSLERCGADILFAAGNCGSDCPDGRCRGVTSRSIYGANSSPYVLTVAGVDTTKKRVGYSSKGPGRLVSKKPDVSGYTHFSGSGVYSADGGTSAACPVVAGVVAAIRTKRPLNFSSPVTRPAAIRNLIRSTAQDLGPTGFDYETGFGVVNGNAVATKLRCPYVLADICKKYPWICRYRNICRRYPRLCRNIIRKPVIRKPFNEQMESVEINSNQDFFSLLESGHFSEEQLEVLEAILSSETETIEESISIKEKDDDCGCKK